MVMTTVGLAEIVKLVGNGLGGTKFDAIALGSGSTAPAASQTALVTELTTNGGARRSGANVTGTQVTTTVTNDTVRLVSTWTFSGTLAVREFGVFNDASAGTMLLRQTFASDLNVASGDELTLTINVKASDEAVASDSVITNAALPEIGKLWATDLTSPTRINAVALGGDDGTSLPLAATNTALGDEFVIADSNGLARSQVTAGPTVTVDSADGTGKTLKVSSTWAPSATVAIKETGLFNSTTEVSGTLFIRHKYASALNLISGDTFTQIIKLVMTG